MTSKTDPAAADLKRRAKAAKARLRRQGVVISDWAIANGVGRSLVYEILRGAKPCHRGQSHRVAVLLGIKDGEIVS